MDGQRFLADGRNRVRRREIAAGADRRQCHIAQRAAEIPRAMEACRPEDAEEGPWQIRRTRPAEPARGIANGVGGAVRPLREDLRSMGRGAHRRPAGFHVVCNNTATSKLVYDFIAGFVRERDGSFVQGRFELFRNYDEYGERFARPRTLLIDSTQLESGDALDTEFRTVAADEIERFRSDL